MQNEKKILEEFESRVKHPYLFEFVNLFNGLETPAGAEKWPISDEHSANLQIMFTLLYEEFPVLPTTDEDLMPFVREYLSSRNSNELPGVYLSRLAVQLTTIPSPYSLELIPAIFIDFIFNTFGIEAVNSQTALRILMRETRLFHLSTTINTGVIK